MEKCIDSIPVYFFYISDHEQLTDQGVGVLVIPKVNLRGTLEIENLDLGRIADGLHHLGRLSVGVGAPGTLTMPPKISVILRGDSPPPACSLN